MQQNIAVLGLGIGFNAGLPAVHLGRLSDNTVGMGIKVPGAQHFVGIGAQVQGNLLPSRSKKIHGLPTPAEEFIPRPRPLFPITPGSILALFGLGIDDQDPESGPTRLGQKTGQAEAGRATAGQDHIVGPVHERGLNPYQRASNQRPTHHCTVVANKVTVTKSTTTTAKP